MSKDSYYCEDEKQLAITKGKVINRSMRLTRAEVYSASTGFWLGFWISAHCPGPWVSYAFVQSHLHLQVPPCGVAFSTHLPAKRQTTLSDGSCMGSCDLFDLNCNICFLRNHLQWARVWIMVAVSWQSCYFRNWISDRMSEKERVKWQIRYCYLIYRKSSYCRSRVIFFTLLFLVRCSS